MPRRANLSQSKTHRDLLVLANGSTNDIQIWKIAEHPHAVIGERRGFEIRMYHNAKWPQPYFVTIIDAKHGFVMDGQTVPTETAAQAEAIAMLASLDGDTTPIGRA